MDDRKMETILDYLNFHNEKHPNREVFIFAHTDGSRTAVTCGELYEKSTRLARSFLSLGVKKDEVVAVSLKNCPEWLYATFGAILAGARPISLAFTYSDGSDVIAMMKKLETCSVIILDQSDDSDSWKIFRKLVNHCDKEGHVESELMPYLRYFICRQSQPESFLTLGDMTEWKTQTSSLPTLKSDDIAFLLQTSGSTGAPKAVAHTHRSVVACFATFAALFSDSPPIRMYNDRPFTWSGGFPRNVITGEARITSYGYSEQPADLVGFIVDVVKKEKCNVLIALPPVLHSLMEQQEIIGADWPVQMVGSAGQPMSKKFASCIGKLGEKFGTGYHSTEFLVGCGLIVENPEDFKDYAVGHALKGVQMKICDDGGETVPANTRGEIYVKSAGMFKEYYNDPEKTKSAFTEDGWFKTDDTGYVTEDGMFFCEGRKSDMIISGGLNVAPAILETAIQNYPGIARVVCVPVAHDVMHQVICACVIVEAGRNVTEDQLRQYCGDIHNDKPRVFTVLPTYYLFLDRLPETYTGKESRKILAKMAAERFLPE